MYGDIRVELSDSTPLHRDNFVALAREGFYDSLLIHRAVPGFVIQGGDAHAWPELWFPGAGWVRFEPTPAIQTGAPPEYADPFTSDVTVPDDILNGQVPPAQPSAPPVTQEEPNTSGMPAVEQETSEGPAWVVVAAVAAALAAAAAGLVWWARRGRPSRRAPANAEQVWSRLRESLPEPMRWSASLTPHEAAEHVEEGMRELDSGLSGHSREALTRLANAVADHRYAPLGTGASVEELTAQAAEIQREAAEAAASGAQRQRSSAGR